MFHSARVKLTGWYLLIIMLISLVFSATIYSITSRELGRGFRRAEMRLRAEELGLPIPRHFPKHWDSLSPELIEDLNNARKRMVINLLVANGVILGVSAIAGYFLAGKTLRPIETALDEQKRFVADASHELRTPLTALKTSLEVALKNKIISLKDARELIKDNLEEVNGLVQLSNNLLNLANYQDNRQALVLQKIDVARVIKSAYRKISPLAKEKGVKINLKLGKQKIITARDDLEKMVLIFLDNAVKYTPGGGRVTLTTRAERKHLVINVRDTGIGINKKDQLHIFDRFYRADQSRAKSKVVGFGLGLSLAKKIINLHQGAVKVVSSPGKGTTFIIKLPLEQS